MRRVALLPMSNRKRLLVRVVLGVTAFVLVGGALLVHRYRQFEKTPLNGGRENIVVELKQGTSFAQFARELHDRGLVSDPRLFQIMARLDGDARDVQAGEYALEPGITPRELLHKLVRGDVVQHSLTLVEGWTFKQVMNAVRDCSALKHTIKPKAGPRAVMAQLGHPEEFPEGRFLPETYHFPRGTTDVEYLNRAYKAMQQFLKKQWTQRADNLPLKSPYQALILASIVERETAVPEERERIAGVFVRRLERGMRLQTDPTVIYGLGDDYHGDITFEDLRKDTPYNTYTRKGLPPTPIAMPSRASIHAALHPEPGKSLYFVATGDGHHHFSATLKEHNEAVRKYQLGRR